MKLMQFRNSLGWFLHLVRRPLLRRQSCPRRPRSTCRLELCSLEMRALPTCLGALVPAYFYPLPGGSLWDQLAADAGQVPIMAIMNPDSGPGAGPDSNYVAAVNKLHAAGGSVIGYVHTSYATRPLDTIQAEIRAYRSWYELDGVFVDEMTNDAQESHLAYYQQLYDYVHRLEPDWTVVGNPGTNTVEAYLSRPTADVLVLFEDGKGYDTYTPPAWQASYPASDFAHLVYNVPSADVMRSYVNLADSRNTGWVYITDRNLPNPWDTLPSYWAEFVAAVAACSPPSPPGDPNGPSPVGVERKEGLFNQGAWTAGPTTVDCPAAPSSPVPLGWGSGHGTPTAGALAMETVQPHRAAVAHYFAGQAEEFGLIAMSP